MKSPYQGLSRDAFWRTGVSAKNIESLSNVYRPKTPVKKNEKVITLGSCFAQHIARNMRKRGYTVFDSEPPPKGLHGLAANKFGYELFSARTGNVYVMRQLLQLFEEAFGLWTPSSIVWEKSGRYFDAMRPSVEPDGHVSPEVVTKHRKNHLANVKTMFKTADVFIFTLGLTEAWMHKDSGDIYPTAPGTIAGEFNNSQYVFKNFTFLEIYEDFMKLKVHLKRVNPKLRFILSVSPVPLTATATDQHVLTATTYSKSVLRGVAGQLALENDDIDYFPSFDILTSTLAAGKLYEKNLRSISPEGVGIAMNTFFNANEVGDGDIEVTSEGASVNSDYLNSSQDSDEEFCEDVLLEAFNK
ncbi:GSCFA domain-containing protein [Alteromonas stellipolaris]|jgi:hypothetical protein|uniref:GSCFA domain-containing protein n=1 Tax=Alteromonas stellipolaris TaxID=233316 RepID=A0AAW7Z8I3_9ALTE|nr:GSCFA domain-containing protein [Alteromonas stellipolaris]MDO6578822.1 GSCFA domain-containing protein [Alteromonas stellipolaris]MDP2536452.1 GSCFA domain-containing protein [Alteromonas stellipolaris]